MKEAVVDPHTIQVLLYVISALSSLVLILIATVAFFLKRLITKVDNLQISVYELNGKVSNITSEVSFIEAEIKGIKERLVRYEEETKLMRERLKALEVLWQVEEKE